MSTPRSFLDSKRRWSRTTIGGAPQSVAARFASVRLRTSRRAVVEVMYARGPPSTSARTVLGVGWHNHGFRMARDRIPRIAHFVFGLRSQDEPFHLVHYLALASCRAVLDPDEIFLHCHELPYGFYWDLARPLVTLRRVARVQRVGHLPVCRSRHRAVLLRPRGRLRAPRRPRRGRRHVRRHRHVVRRRAPRGAVARRVRHRSGAGRAPRAQWPDPAVAFERADHGRAGIGVRGPMARADRRGLRRLLVGSQLLPRPRPGRRASGRRSTSSRSAPFMRSRRPRPASTACWSNGRRI